jgi:hypothetical protein
VIRDECNITAIRNYNVLCYALCLFHAVRMIYNYRPVPNRFPVSLVIFHTILPGLNKENYSSYVILKLLVRQLLCGGLYACSHRWTGLVKLVPSSNMEALRGLLGSLVRSFFQFELPLKRGAVCVNLRFVFSGWIVSNRWILFKHSAQSKVDVLSAVSLYDDLLQELFDT